jgi:enoyl-CoA hydratase
MEYTSILVEKAGGIATVTVNRPDKLNALNQKVVSELTHVIHHFRFAKTPEDVVRAVILTGAGEKSFVAGGDISEMSAMTPPEALAFSESGHRMLLQFEMAPFPIIAAVNGFALGGGCELLLGCDFAFASEKAKFGQPEVNLGVIPGFGGTQRLIRRVGIAKARELIYTGAMIGAEEAKRIGLVNDVFAPAELLEKTRAVAQKIVEKGPLAIASAKRVMLKGADLELTSANELEAQAFGVLFGSADQKEGMRAFLEKRAAVFAGKLLHQVPLPLGPGQPSTHAGASFTCHQSPVGRGRHTSEPPPNAAAPSSDRPRQRSAARLVSLPTRRSASAGFDRTSYRHGAAGGPAAPVFSKLEEHTGCSKNSSVVSFRSSARSRSRTRSRATCATRARRR